MTKFNLTLVSPSPTTPSENEAIEPTEVLTPEERQRRYKQRHWQTYKTKRNRIYGTVLPEEYQEIQALAHTQGRSIWRQVWLESQAYRRQEFLPSSAVEEKIHGLYVELRRIGNNLNQLAKVANSRGHVENPELVRAQLQQLEVTIASFVQTPWR